jgi:hypothetical protein
LFEFRFNKIIPKRHFCVVTDARTQVSVAAKNLLELVYEGADQTEYIM